MKGTFSFFRLFLVLSLCTMLLLVTPALSARNTDTDEEEQVFQPTTKSSRMQVPVAADQGSGGGSITVSDVDPNSEEAKEIQDREYRRRQRESRQPTTVRRVRTPRTGRTSVSGDPAADSSISGTGVSASGNIQPQEPASDPWSDNFLILLRAKEGISHWKYVVNDFLLLGMDTNRTIVEPCIRDGKIFPCMHCLSNETLTLSTVIDLSIIKNHFPELRIITWSEYTLKYHSKMPSIVCYNRNSREFSQDILNFDSEIIKPGSSDGDAPTYEDCVRSAKNFGNSVYLHSPWKYEVLRRGIPLTMTIPWKYAPFQHTIATRIMKDAKIDLDRYFVFNWRMESTPRKHLLPCAKMIVAFSEEWLEKFDGDRLNAMIVTDLSFSKTDTKWGDMTTQMSMDIYGNVTHLLDTNFFKIETSNAVKGTIKQFPRYRDSIFLTIWEIIISEKATLFVTCTQKNEVCDYCSKIKSKFAEDIIRNRYMGKLNSYESWALSSYTHTSPVSIAEYMTESNEVTR